MWLLLPLLLFGYVKQLQQQQQHRSRFTSLRSTASPAMKPSVSSPLILGKHAPASAAPPLRISVCCFGIFIWEAGDSAGVRPRSEKHWRLTNKQTDAPKDNKACGQTARWWTSEPTMEEGSGGASDGCTVTDSLLLGIQLSRLL